MARLGFEPMISRSGRYYIDPLLEKSTYLSHIHCDETKSVKVLVSVLPE
jgi:hypothetical protein